MLLYLLGGLSFFIAGVFLDFIVFLSALFISSSIVTPEKKSFKETVKKATYTSFFVLLIVTLCKIAIPWSSLLLGIILVLAFGYGYHFYDGGEWLSIFALALLLAFIFMLVEASVLAVIKGGSY